MSSAATYDDVAVVVNTNSSASMEIGSYFKLKRSIPAINMIYISTNTTEIIDATTFDALRSQIESYLTANNLVNSINYIVTTKGVPLKIDRGNTFSTTSPSASVESELTLILGSYASYIGQAGKPLSPYYYQSSSFSRSAFGIYLVTRLDAYTVQEVYDMIDKSGPDIVASPSAKFVLDQDPAWNSTIPSLNNYLTTTKTVLEAKGETVELNTDTTYLTNESQVIGYTSWGSNDHYTNYYTQYAIPNNTWAPGAIAETYVSTSGRSFSDPPSYGQSLIADLIEEGISGAKGYVYEPYSSAMAIPFVLFDRYTAGNNLAESFYMSSRYLSWMDVIVGDPKTSINGVTGPLPIQLYYFTASLAQSANNVELRWGTLSELNNYGFYVQWKDTSSAAFTTIPSSFIPGHGTTTEPQAYSFVHVNVPPGVYKYRLLQIDLDGAEHFSDARIVSITSTTGVKEELIPEMLDLAQNYPNPFNPSTTIRYQLPREARVSLKVYSELGQEVATLVNDVQPSGRYSVIFNAGDDNTRGTRPISIASSVYFYRLQVGEEVITRRMILVK
jgi:uncharacterized protein (TIGR03790 family)